MTNIVELETRLAELQKSKQNIMAQLSATVGAEGEIMRLIADLKVKKKPPVKRKK